MSSPPSVGLRERKKRRTRQAISDIATRLFVERGFEDVTLTEIADAAEVSVKTVLNYFGTKEELYFDRAEELETSIVRAIADRPPGASVLSSLATLLADNRVPFADDGWDGLLDASGYEAFRSFLEAEERSPALRGRRLLLEESLGDRLASVLAAQLGQEPDHLPTRAFAAMLLAALQLRGRVLRTSVLANLPPDLVRREVQETVRTAFERLQAAFGDLDRMARG